MLPIQEVQQSFVLVDLSVKLQIEIQGIYFGGQVANRTVLLYLFLPAHASLRIVGSALEYLALLPPKSRNIGLDLYIHHDCCMEGREGANRVSCNIKVLKPAAPSCSMSYMLGWGSVAEADFGGLPSQLSEVVALAFVVPLFEAE